LSVFSKSKKQTILDHLHLHNAFKQLQEYLQAAKDFSAKQFAGDLMSKKNSLNSIQIEIAKADNEFDQIIEKEFDSFGFASILDIAESKHLFQSIDSQIIDIKSSDSFSSKLLSIKPSFENYLNEANALFNDISNLILKSNDIDLNYSFDGSFNNKKKLLPRLKMDLEQIEETFDSKIQTEFQRISLLNVSPNEIEIKSLPLLQEKVNTLFDKIKNDNWTIEKIKFTEFYKFITDLESLIRKKAQYFDSENDLFTIEFKWFQFYNDLSESNKILVNELKAKTNWRKSFLVYYLNSMLVNSADMDLPTNDNEHIQLSDALNGLETEQLKFIKQYWYSRQIDATSEFQQRNSNLSVENLYNKRSSNRYKRLSLRQIVQYDADLFSTFFPIILTSPDVASNLFKGMNGYFDIVMFDEASQLRLEDNLPAILKGKQIVIAGDEHQMPPSNYFGKMFSGEIESDEDIEEEETVTKISIDKDDILLSCESLLEFGSELNFQRKHLDFHYRSRHPYLIDFSNFAFYNQRLKPLPHNFDYIPIKYIQVNGTFSDHTNDAEAEMVLSIIEHNINRLPNGDYPTVGVATFNIAQRNLILEKIRARQKFPKYMKFNAKIEELELDNPKSTKSFIKNLENIQGDERDVIILSTTYGINKDRKFAQRFGPINHSKGYKLLNVIITRAKFKIYVCSSIPEQVFMDYKGYLNTEGSNNRRAVLFAYLAYCKAVSENNNALRISVLTTLSENTIKSASFDSFRGGDLESPFEEEVYQSLVDYFGAEKLFPQLPFAGFIIDIVYDPKLVGVPKIAIECDGAKFHSSREAYLYDTHRQKILENHGFVFHRIWSTNWWRNTKRETTKLIEFIRDKETKINYDLKDYSRTSFAFTDNILKLENYVAKNTEVDFTMDESIIKSTEDVKSKHTSLIDLVEAEMQNQEKNEIQKGDIIKVKYLNNGKELKVIISDSINSKLETQDGIMKIKINSPLAGSILNHSVGDIIKVGNLDNYVEIMEIVKV
jgi:very-short-patch-repair endonuclease